MAYYYGGDYSYGFRPYVPVHQRRSNAQRKLPQILGKGKTPAPVQGAGTKIAASFWGQSWCRNLERYSDFANRLPRGRTYVRNGSVVHLDVLPGEVHAYVSGSELYTVKIKIKPLPAPRWRALCDDCVGSVASLVELLQGDLDASVMERVCREATGLFPAPAEIDLDCSCPDYADMCKHVAAVLYGVGVRLDDDPAVLFRLRQVSAEQLVAGAAEGLALPKKGPARGQVLAESDVAAVFGVELGGTEEPAPAAKPRAKAKKPVKKPVKKAVKKPVKKAEKPRKPAAKAKAKSEGPGGGGGKPRRG